MLNSAPAAILFESYVLILVFKQTFVFSPTWAAYLKSPFFGVLLFWRHSSSWPSLTQNHYIFSSISESPDLRNAFCSTANAYLCSRTP